MASIRLMVVTTILAVFSLRGVLGDLKCEELPVDVCAFSVQSTGARCVLEKTIMRDGSALYECLTSEEIAEKIYEWIETEECIDACGVERMQVGMSTDGLLESGFTKKLCSEKCYNTCPNIINLYFNLAAGEGLHLPTLCEAQRSGSRRMMSHVLSLAKTSVTEDSFEFSAAPLPSQDITAAPASPPSP